MVKNYRHLLSGKIVQIPVSVDVCWVSVNRNPYSHGPFRHRGLDLSFSSLSIISLGQKKSRKGNCRASTDFSASIGFVQQVPRF